MVRNPLRNVKVRTYKFAFLIFNLVNDMKPQFASHERQA